MVAETRRILAQAKNPCNRHRDLETWNRHCSQSSLRLMMEFDRIRRMNGMILQAFFPLLDAIGVNPGGHAVFSRHGVPLLLLPRNPSMSRETVRLYKPQTPMAKGAALVLAGLCRFGLHRCLPTLLGDGDDSGVLLCNSAHGIRAVVLRKDDAGRLVIAKATTAEFAEPLRKEHATLLRLQGRPGVPPVGTLLGKANAVWFEMPHLGKAPRDLDSVPLLRSWETGFREAASKNGLIRDLLPLLDEPTRDALAGMTVRRTLVHGDFVPWNWRTDGNGDLVCIDWEWAREDGFAGFDLVYCLVQQALLVKKVPADRLRAHVANAVSRLSPDGRSLLAESGLPLDLLISLVLAYRRSKGIDEPSHGGGTPPFQSGRAAPVGQGPTGAALPRFLAIEGADGVGKSTVLRLLVPELVRRGGFDGYLFFHWKPVNRNISYDAIPGDDPHNPRGKVPRNPLASFLFLVHHWLDFQLGYWKNVRPAVRAGKFVVADRYAYDVLLDPLRFRLRLPTWILRFFVQTIPRPDKTILLYAVPEVIQTRKPELSKQEIVAYQAALLACPAIRNPLAIDAGPAPSRIVDSIVSQSQQTDSD